LAEDKIDCKYFQSKIQDFLADELSPEERIKFLKHKEVCQKCFKLLVDAEPSQIFSRLREQRMPSTFWQGFLPAIKEGVEREGVIKRWLPLPTGFRRLAVLAAGFLLIFSIFLWLYFAPKFKPAQRPQELAKLSIEVPAKMKGKMANLRAKYPTIELLENRGARLYNFLLKDDVEVVMIFDKNID